LKLTDVSEASIVSNIRAMMEAVRTSETSVDNHYTRQYIPEDSLMMEAVRTSETSVDNHYTRQYIPEDSLMMEAVRTTETSVDNHYTRQYIPEDSLIMEAVRTSETSVNFKVTTRRYIPEDSKLHIRRRQNVKSHVVNLYGETALLCFRPFENLSP
jgi:uncharacterized protein (DUF427 family)